MGRRGEGSGVFVRDGGLVGWVWEAEMEMEMRGGVKGYGAESRDRMGWGRGRWRRAGSIRIDQMLGGNRKHEGKGTCLKKYVESNYVDSKIYN